MPDFDPFSAEVLDDPYPHYRWLRDEHPCLHVAKGNFYVVSRYDDVNATLRNHAVFSSTGGVGLEWNRRPVMSMSDPPEHARLRRIVAKHFTPRGIETQRPKIEEKVRTLLDALLEAKHGDLVADFAEPLTATVIGNLLGVPRERHEDFRRWTHHILADLAFGGLDPDAVANAEVSRREFVRFLKESIAERERNPTGDDVICRLLAARETEALTREELIAFCVLLLVAGFETTVNGLCNVALGMVTHPDQWQLVVNDPSLVPAMIEEGLRYDSPVHAFFRNTLAEITVAGVVIPPNVKVMVLYASANRDPAHFESPDELRVMRNPQDHLAFGSGIHHCIGAPLARLQYGIVAHAFLQRVQSAAVDGALVRTRNAIVHGLQRMPISIRAK